MFCNKCGKEVPEGSAFCPSCGAPVAAGDGDGGAAGRRPKRKRSRLPVVIAVVAVLVVGAGAAWALTGGLGTGAQQPAPAGSAQEPAQEDAPGDGATEAAEEGDENGEAGAITDGTVTVSGVRVERVDVTKIPSDFLEGGERGRGTSLDSIGTGTPYGESLFMITAHASNESQNSVKGWLTFDCDITYQDSYGEEQTSTGSFSTRIYNTVEDYADNGSFYLAPGEERDVTLFCAWRDGDPGVAEWNTEMGTFPTSGADAAVGGNSNHAVVISGVECSGVGSAAFGGRHAVGTLDDFDVEAADGGQVFAYETTSFARLLGGEVSLTNNTGGRLESVTVGVRYAIDGELTPYVGYYQASKLSVGEEADIRSDGRTGTGPQGTDTEGVTVVPWYVVYERE